jgi:hypothetical protein
LSARDRAIARSHGVVRVAVQVINGRKTAGPGLRGCLRIGGAGVARVEPSARAARRRQARKAQPSQRRAARHERFEIEAELSLIGSVDEEQVFAIGLKRRVVQLICRQHHRHHEAEQLRRAWIDERHPATLGVAAVEPMVAAVGLTQVFRSAERGLTFFGGLHYVVTAPRLATIGRARFGAGASVGTAQSSARRSACATRSRSACRNTTVVATRSPLTRRARITPITSCLIARQQLVAVAARAKRQGASEQGRLIEPQTPHAITLPPGQKHSRQAANRASCSWGSGCAKTPT